jgi:hypothetical protein
MNATVATQLITVLATLAGALLSLVANAFLERRRARDARDLHSLQHESEHARWLRDERVQAYAAFALAVEGTLEFLRSEMPRLIGSQATAGRDDIARRWAELRTELRKAYNQVALFGADAAQSVALEAWRAARTGGNDFLRQLETATTPKPSDPDLRAMLKDLTSSLGTLGNQFLRACRDELQASQARTTARLED